MRDELWGMYNEALRPVYKMGKLGVVLFQFQARVVRSRHLTAIRCRSSHATALACTFKNAELVCATQCGSDLI